MKRSIIRVMAIAALLFIAGSQPADVGAAPGPRIRLSQSVSKDVGFCSPIAVPCLVLEPQGSGFPPSSAVTYTLTLCDTAGVCVPTTSQECLLSSDDGSDLIGPQAGDLFRRSIQ